MPPVKCCASGIDERKNTLARGKGMSSTSLNANLAIDDANNCGDTAGCTTGNRIANGINLKLAQIIFNVAMALTFAVDRASHDRPYTNSMSATHKSL
ncbi:hypothetical protein N7509_013011 [Penicillium cosmopolitanum]|uniref:Uncharacterized protein n=1 Tax=Penicillium cosmopolitanum TaxID=1131564 RepID=A0A9W9SDQ2_9EURO|nr:uncharacterized protein N7509_013011 [Penicillium cosmopolitanum]KAJ5376125.1 hypothetical protein N7509_013011 [Penicillium cosmopolitanum]